MTTSHSWAVALAVAGGVTALVVPIASRRSSSRRRGGARHHLLGGATGLAAGAAASLVFLRDADTALIVGVLAGLALFAVGELVDRGLLPRRLRWLFVLAMAVAVVGAGLRIRLAGFDGGDAALTILVVFASSIGWRPGSDHDPRLLAWAVTIAATAGTLGGLAGQTAVAAGGAALAGSSAAVLLWWVSPRSARLGSSGSTLLGFLAAVVAIDARPALGTPRDAAVPLILLALPMIDALLIAVARARRPGTEAVHLALTGRLRALGLSEGAATLLLIALQLGLGVLTLFVGRGVWSLTLAGGVALATVAIVTLACLVAPSSRSPARWSRPIVVGAVGVVLLGVVLGAPAAVALLRGRTAANAGAGAALAGLAAAQRGDAQVAASAFAAAESEFATAHQRVTSPLASGGLAVPVLSPNLDAARKLSALGLDLSRVGHQLATTADPQRLRIQNGTVNLPELARLEPQLRSAAGSLVQASRRLDAIDRRFLVASVDDSVGKLQRRLHKAVHDARIASEAATILQAVLGGSGPRRYFVAVENSAETRATGGFFGSWGILTALNGKLSLGDVQPITALDPKPGDHRVLHAPADYVARYERFFPENSWPNVNFSPDLPTVGAVAADLLPQSGAGPVDGVITIDPVGLARILELTGPISVPPWPEAITAQNLVDVTLNRAYVTFPDRTERQNFLGDVAKAAWDAFSKGDVGSPARVLRSLGQAAHEKHLAIWLKDPAAEQLVRDANVDAGVPPPQPTRDYSLVTTQNVEGNKLDLYLHKRVQYAIQLTPESGRRIAVRSHVGLTLTNSSPTSGLPQEVLGPNPGFGSPGHGAGFNTSFVTVYSPLRLAGATLGGSPTTLSTLPELGYDASAATITLAPGATQTLGVQLDGTVDRGSNGQYALRIGRQPVATPDDLEVTVTVPSGWKIAPGGPLRPDASGRTARYIGRLDRDRVITVGLERARGSSLWARLQDGPRP